MKIKLVTCLFVITTVFTSCWDNKESASVNLNISLSWFGESAEIGDTVMYNGNMPLRLEKFKCYLDDISLRDTEGNWISSGSIDMIEFMPANESTTAYFNPGDVKNGLEINAIRIGLGVNSFYNVLEDAPSTFPNDHPLGISGSAGMYWTWATGYIFTKFEGKIASEEGGEFEFPFAFHTGTNDLYREVVMELPSSIIIAAEESYDFNIEIDLGKTIATSEDELDLVNDGITHTLNHPDLAERYVNLLDDAWTIIE